MSPLFIKHRANRIVDLRDVGSEWGAEIDLRSKWDASGEIHLTHDPWTTGDSLSEWLAEYSRLGIRGPLILNTKEDGLEARATELLEWAGVENYFFLDTAIPTLVKRTAEATSRKFAVRVSKYEPAEFAGIFRNRVEWVWVDCFGGVPLAKNEVEPLKKDFRICVVSPELHGFPNEISRFGELYPLADAICTKSPSEWRRFG